MIREDVTGRGSTATRDFIALCGVVAAAYFVAVYFEAFENFGRWARGYERWQVDELVVVPLVLALAFVFFSWRRGKEVKESEQRFRSLVQNAADVILIMGPDQTVRYVSPAVESVLGYEPEELVGKDNFAPVHPEDLARVRGAVADALSNPGTPSHVELRLRHADGSWRHLESTCTSLPGAPAVGGIVFNSRDVTGRRRAEDALRAAEARYRTLVEQIPVATYVQEVVHNNATTYISPQVEGMLGYSPREYTEDPRLWLNALHPDDRGRVLAEDGRANATGEPFRMEYRMIGRDGGVVWVQDEAVLVRDEAGRPLSWQGFMLDVTERKRTEEELRRSEARNRSILEAIPDLIFRFGREGEYLDFQADAADLYVPQERIVGRNLREVMPAEIAEPAIRHIARTLETGEMQVFEYRLPAPDGVRDYEARMVVDGPGEVLSLVRDTTESKSLQRRLEHRASHDDLTGLPNRALFAERLGRALARPDRRGCRVAVLFLDIDDFKSVNDSLGHWAGDALLTRFARRLTALTRPGDTVARFGGDEFAVLLENVTQSEAAGVAGRMIEELRRDPFVIEGREIFAAPSIGVAVSGYAELGWQDLLRRADLALHRAKEGGRAHHLCFTPDLDGRLRERLKLEGELRKALERGEFRVFYQPKVTISSGEISGMEALVRWQHPERGLLPPSEFLAVAEETGLVVSIGGWMLRQACRQAKEWQERYLKDPPLAMSVNLSAKQFQRRDLAREVEEVLGECGLDPRTLTLELTEETAMDDARTTTEALWRLKGMGVRIEVDDFGTGYSSLSYLKRFPVDYLKIDRSFVGGLGRNPEDEGIVRAVVALGHTLGLTVVAEGVENDEQLGRLREMGCELAQGHYFCDAVPAEAAGKLLAARNP